MSNPRTQSDPRRAHHDIGAPRRDRRSDRARPRELDINPLLADQDGVMQSMRGWRSRRSQAGISGPAICVRCARTTRTCFALSSSVGRRRICGCASSRLCDLSHRFIARPTQIDYARATALVAIDQSSGEMLGVVQLHADANYDKGEYAVLVRSDLKGLGLGWRLMQIIIEYARWPAPRRSRARCCARTAPCSHVSRTRLRHRART
jgi:hypothetical protein